MSSSAAQLADAAADLQGMLAATFEPRARGFEPIDPADVEAFIATGSETTDLEARIAAAYQALDSSASYVHSLAQFAALVRADIVHRQLHGRPRSRGQLEAELARHMGVTPCEVPR